VSDRFVPGEVVTGDDPVRINEGRATATVTVRNTGDRPVQVDSHFHFFEVNRALAFERGAAFGYHLDVPAGTAVRFEPGEERDVDLVAFGGKRRVVGLNGLTDGTTAGDGVPRPATGLVCCHSFLVDALGAVQRVRRFSHVALQRVLVDLAPVAASVSGTYVDVPLDAVRPFAPRVDLASTRHERADRRLFRS
jgi:urease subunit beta